MMPKFRVWDEENKRFLDEEEFVIISDGRVLVGDWMTGNDFSYGYDDHERFILMQSTGLKDKNGVEIYAGDILDIKANFKRLGFVIFDHGKFKVQHVEDTLFYDFTQVLSQCEAMGNVFENKELLEAVK